jgi:hypothetical protein
MAKEKRTLLALMPGQDLLHDPEAMAQFWSLLNGQPVTPELVAEMRRMMEEESKKTNH